MTISYVFELPESDGWSRNVSLESRKGTWLSCTISAPTGMRAAQ